MAVSLQIFDYSCFLARRKFSKYSCFLQRSGKVIFGQFFQLSAGKAKFIVDSQSAANRKCYRLLVACKDLYFYMECLQLSDSTGSALPGCVKESYISQQDTVFFQLIGKYGFLHRFVGHRDYLHTVF